MSISHSLITQLVTLALDEDLNYQTAQEGDITAQLIPKNEQANAKVITREDCIFCGKDIILEVFKQVDPSVKVNVLINDGDAVKANSTLFTAIGSARSILTAERTALNFVQTLSGRLLALKLEDGSEYWVYNASVPVLTLRGTSTPVVFRDQVIAGFANGRVTAFDIESGGINWDARVAIAQGGDEGGALGSQRPLGPVRIGMNMQLECDCL